MKLFILITVFLYPTFSVLAQDISLDNLIFMRNGNIETVNSTLLTKGWSFKGSEDSTYSQNGCAYQQTVWVFRPDEYSDAAKGFINFYTNNECQTFIGYVVFDIQSYQKVRQAIDKYGMRLISSTTDIDNNNGKPYTESVFAGAKYKVLIDVVNNSDESQRVKNMYQIYVYKK